MRRRVIGCMSGTSLDGLDAALVEIEGRGLSMTATFVRAMSRSLGEFGAELRAIAEQSLATAAQIADVSRRFGLLHAELIAELLQGGTADLVCVHGQTVYHHPPLSWQLVNATPLALAVNAPVVFDLRAADLASGGQGAPMTPLADAVLFGGTPEARCVVNLGGFCNITVLPAGGVNQIEHIEGQDVCACNHALDEIARAALGTSIDVGGRAALAGSADATLVNGLTDLLTRQAGGGRSLGTGDEIKPWILGRVRSISGPDLAASACAAIGLVIAAAAFRASSGVQRLILAGGGVKNAALVSAITVSARRLAVQPRRPGSETVVCLSDAMGVPAAYREAIAMAVLGALCQDRVPITLPRVTGVRAPAPIAGVWVLP